MTDEIIGNVLEVLIANNSTSIKSIPVDMVEVTFEGIIGVKHSGLTKLSDSRTKILPQRDGNSKHTQISIVSNEELADIAAELKIAVLLPDWFGANFFYQEF